MISNVAALKKSTINSSQFVSIYCSRILCYYKLSVSSVCGSTFFFFLLTFHTFEWDQSVDTADSKTTQSSDKKNKKDSTYIRTSSSKKLRWPTNMINMQSFLTYYFVMWTLYFCYCLLCRDHHDELYYDCLWGNFLFASIINLYAVLLINLDKLDQISCFTRNNTRKPWVVSTHDWFQSEH